MRFASLGSGSAGNALVVEAGNTRILLDCGFNLKETCLRLGRLGLRAESITAVVLTHEHDDHASGAFKLAAKFNLPVWGTYGTFKMTARYWPTQRPVLNEIDSHTPFAIGDMICQPFPVPHDAREPVQFTFSNGEKKLGVLTDVGNITPHIIEQLNLCHGLVLECNHDKTMLAQGPYHNALKKRVGGTLGHLDNEASAQLLSQLDNSKLKHLVAAHLSTVNNTPQQAKKKLADAIFWAENAIHVADQALGFDWLHP